MLRKLVVYLYHNNNTNTIKDMIAQLDAKSFKVIRFWKSVKEAADFFKTRDENISTAVYMFPRGSRKVTVSSCWANVRDLESQDYVPGDRYVVFRAGKFKKMYVAKSRIADDLGLTDVMVENIVNGKFQHHIYDIKQIK